jgi:HlyD family secretion protein
MDTLVANPPLLPTRPDRSKTPNGSGEPRRDRAERAPFPQGARGALLTGLVLVVAAASTLVVSRAYPRSLANRYRTETVARGQVTGVLRVPGRLVPTAQIRVGATEPSRVANVAVRPGERVERGQVLATLDSRQLRAAELAAQATTLAAQVGARQAQVKMAEIAYLLQRERSASSDPEVAAAALQGEIDLVNATAMFKRQAAEWVIARDRLAAATVRAPLSGLIIERAVEPGDTVPPGAPMFVIASDPKELELTAPISEIDAARLRPGKVTFQVPAHPGRTFEAQSDGVPEPAPVASGAPYRVRLRARNDDGALAVGMSARLEIPAQSADRVVTVPAEAVSFAPAGESSGGAVYVMSGPHPRRIAVTTGVADADRIELRDAPLADDARVIVGER